MPIQHEGLFGLNINLGGLRGRDQEAKEDAARLEARSHLLMTTPSSGIDGPGEIRQLREWEDALEGSQITRRTYSRKEGNWSTYMPVKEQVALWKGQGLFSMLHDAPSNEPALNGSDESLNRRFVARETEMIYRCADAGIAYLTSAFSVGTPDIDLIRRGVYDPLLIALSETRAVGSGISAHLYGLANVEAGERVGYQVLLDPQQARSAMTDTKWPLGNYYLVKRTDEFMKRADEIGAERPDIFATEAKIDLIPDANWVLNQLRPRYGMPEYNFDMRGIQSIRLLLAAIFPEMSYEQAVAHITAYFGRNVWYADEFKSIMLFSLNWLWDQPQGHNYANPMLRTFLKVYLPEINRILKGQKVTFPDNNDTRWTMGTLQATGIATNVRAEPKRGQNVLGQLEGPVTGYELAGESLPDQGGENYTWRIVRFVDTQGKELVGHIAEGFYDFMPEDDKSDPVIIDPLPIEIDELNYDLLASNIVDRIMPQVDQWLTDNIQGFITQWLEDNPAEIALHVSAHILDTPKSFKLAMARVLYQTALSIEEEFRPKETEEATPSK